MLVYTSALIWMIQTYPDNLKSEQSITHNYY